MDNTTATTTIENPQETMPPAAVTQDDTAPVGWDRAHLHRKIELEDRKKTLTGQLNTVKDELEQLDSVITAMLLGEGLDSVKCDGRLIYLATDVFVGPNEQSDKNDLIRELKACEDASVFVGESYNTASLKSWVKEIAESVLQECRAKGELYDESKVLAALPGALPSVMKISFGKAVRIRKA